MGGMFGGAKGVDNSAYEKQLAEEKEQTRREEDRAARMKQQQDAAYERQRQGRASTLLTGAQGDSSTAAVKRKSLLGGN